MKRGLVTLFVLLGCATAPPPISGERAQAFQDTVERAKRAGADDAYSAAGHKLRDAESDFYYAEHLPHDPVKARRLAEQAQQEADEALRLASHQIAARSVTH